eukprot:238809-Rhodomonas_salina.3
MKPRCLISLERLWRPSRLLSLSAVTSPLPFLILFPWEQIDRWDAQERGETTVLLAEALEAAGRADESEATLRQ